MYVTCVLLASTFSSFTACLNGQLHAPASETLSECYTAHATEQLYNSKDKVLITENTVSATFIRNSEQRNGTSINYAKSSSIKQQRLQEICERPTLLDNVCVTDSSVSVSVM